MYTASHALIEALQEAGVTYLFANFGSDHPSIIEGLAEAKAMGKLHPRVITCPNEMVALSAAHGYAQATGRAQAVLVHVDCGTQSLGGAVHNAAKGRVPVLILAGLSPLTQEGELRGSRNEFIHWIQDGFDQRGLVRGYVKYEAELRTARNIKQMVRRSLQIAHSDPQGPVYLTAAREVLAEELDPVPQDTARWPDLAPCALSARSIEALTVDLLAARLPLIVTSYLGRSTTAVRELVSLSQRLAVGILESVPTYVNFPPDNSMYQGNQWNDPCQNRVLGEADCILVLDSDVPWIPTINKPHNQARLYHIDIDPLKEHMPLWYIPVTKSFRADAATALRQINDYLDTKTIDIEAVETRRSHYSSLHTIRARNLVGRERADTKVITPEYLTSCVRHCMDDNTIFVNEAISNYKTVNDHLRAHPGTMFASGGGSLGWSGGAAIGIKLARPDNTVVCLTGDGSFMFSAPSSVHWMARQYKTPFVQIIYNNRGWTSPKLSTLAMYPDGYASREDGVGFAFDPSPDYSGVAAAAGGAFASIVQRPEELDHALNRALAVVQKEHRCAVLDVWLPHL